MEQHLGSHVSFPLCSKIKSSQTALLRAEKTGGCGVPQPITMTLIRNGVSVKVSELLLVACANHCLI